ncbi:MAG: succinate dehydrogenase, cytochrome b556 subunit [Pseudomonadota bacterium]|nr:succinate dehydrogenase, cytochrome b556 subunit [Pseudomonadota bacterium]
MVLISGKNSDPRPVFLNLLKIYLPRTALVSILHRVSGVGLVLSLPILVVMLYEVASYSAHVGLLSFYTRSIVLHLWVFLVITGAAFHLLAGVRHLLMDMFFIHDLSSGRYMADAVFILWFMWIVFVLWSMGSSLYVLS